MKLIPKDAVLAEIEKTFNFHEKRGSIHDASICDVLYGLLHRINTLEVKEVDLEKEVELWMQGKPSVEFEWGNVADAMRDCAKHFFELALSVSNKVKKGEEV